MSQVSKLLTDEVYKFAVNGLKTLGKYGAIASKLQIMIAAKKHGISTVCRIHGISRTTLTTWIKELKEGVLEDLSNKTKQPRSVLHPYLYKIREWVDENHNITAREIVVKIKESFEVITSRSSVYRALHKLKLVHITPRPSHYKKSLNSEDEFKKKFSN